MFRALVLALLLLPTLASAQVTVVESSDFPNGSDQIINISECKAEVRSQFSISWKVPSTAGTVTGIDVRISDTAGCPLASTSNTAKTKSLGTSTSTSGALASARAASDLAAAVGIACDNGSLQTVNICAVALSGGTELTNGTQSTTIQFDQVTPSKPQISSVGPGDSALDVSWNPVSSANRYQVTATPQGGGTPVQSGELTNTTSHRQGNLTNGTPYDVTVVAITIGGNRSVASDPVTGTPVLVNDFWRLYKNDGGQEMGGCGTHGAGSLSLVLLALAALVVRWRRRALPLLALAAAFSASPARAESPRYGTFSLQFTPYRPNIDAEFHGAAAPYQTAFGGGKKLMIRGELAYSLIQQYGTLDLGFSAGYFQARGKGRLSTDGSQSSDVTALRVIPTSLSLTYRADQLANRGIVPLAPYVRFAFERFNWWVTNGSNGVAGANGLRGSGATNGYSLTGGLAFLLDFIDTGLAREMDNDTGINHTYLFGEVTKYSVDDFGSKSSWDLGNTGSVVYGFGLMFVF
jgi:hypothetical protein